MMTSAHCPTCHYRARWDTDLGAAVEVLQVGGSRQPAVPEALAAWRIWRASRAGQTGPVVASCPACALPLLADDASAPTDAPHTLTTPLGRVQIGADTLTLDGEPTDADALDAQLERALGPRLRASDVLAVQNVFGLAFLTILGTVAVLWVFAALFLVRFVIAIGVQDNVSIPLPP